MAKDDIPRPSKRTGAKRTAQDSPSKQEIALPKEFGLAKEGASSPVPRPINQYHVFLASPGDVNLERLEILHTGEDVNGKNGQAHSAEEKQGAPLTETNPTTQESNK